MRARLLTSVVILSGGLMLAGTPGFAQDALSKPAGLWLATDFPDITEHIGDNATLGITLSNVNRPLATVAFSLDGLPTGWNWELSGDGKPVSAAMVTPDQSQHLNLKLTPPKNAKPGTYSFAVQGKTGDGQMLNLPLSLTLATQDPAKVTLQPDLPALRGTPQSSFDFNVAIKNDSPAAATFNLIAAAPPGFVATFKEQYGSQELTSIPLKAGESKTLKVSVSPPKTVAAGQYAVEVDASSAKAKGETQLGLGITGQPRIGLSRPDGRLSGQAVAGKETTVNFTLNNSGTAPAKDVAVSANAPTGWKVEFEPKSLESLAPNDQQQVVMHVTPSNKAIAGDYMVNVSANGAGASDNTDFRVTVTTSTMWGAAGLGVIGAAVVVLGFAVTRYGRR
jgi:uncharacterized membrane protein